MACSMSACEASVIETWKATAATPHTTPMTMVRKKSLWASVGAKRILGAKEVEAPEADGGAEATPDVLAPVDGTLEGGLGALRLGTLLQSSAEVTPRWPKVPCAASSGHDATSGGSVRWGEERTGRCDVSVFGPFYPPALQAVVNHSERLSELLVVHELAPPTQEWANVWMTGRADEVVRFAEHVVAQWREGRIGEDEAAATLDGYLVTLHEGLARHLRCDAPSCCEGSSAATARPGRMGRRRPADRTGENDCTGPTSLATMDSLLLAEALRPREGDD